MQLKKLQLIGFKTFAEKTEIEIGEGLTAVVGPNGSGKSNIADALLWVLGEQNPRLLRGSDNRDVIFSGTDRRKPLGMAEVRLTIDNADKALPIDFAEVTITRRVFRSGESQYLLNNSPCRLKDIVELFLDTGVGKGAYGFVSQSEVDAVLSARAEDRRELFEEAAGIKKYRVKKREAVRKLEAAEGNLTRVRDIINELEQQREPLAEQAETAARYCSLTERLQQIEVDLLLTDVKKADYELYSARQERDLDREAIARFDDDLARLERESSATGGRLAQAEQEAEVARIAHQGAHSTVERAEGQVQLLQERGAAAEQSADSLDEEIRALEARAAEIRRETEKQAAERERTFRQEQGSKEGLISARATLAEVDAAWREAVRLSEDKQELLRRLAGQRAERESALTACSARLAETEDRLARLEEAITGSESAFAQSRIRERGAADSVQAARGAAEDAAARRRGAEDALRSLRSRESAARADLDQARRLLAERSSRLNTLTELQESGEGFYQGVRAALKAHRDGELRGFYAPAVDLLTVPEELRIAIEVALGASLQDVVCETEEQAKTAIEWLKSRRAGRATFLALPLLRPGSRVQPGHMAGEGLVGVAADLVSAETRFQPVLHLLLNRVVIARDMDSAIHLSRRLQGWSRIVTIEGELITPGGAMTGGSLQGRGAHLVGRKGEIDDLRKTVPELRAAVERSQSEVDSAAGEIAKCDHTLAEINRELADLLSTLGAAESEAAASRRDSERAEAGLREQRNESERLIAVRAKLAGERERWQAAVEQGRAEDTGADDAISRAREQAQQLADSRESARAQAVTLEVEVSRLAEKRAGIERALKASELALHQSESARELKRIQRESAGAQFAGANAQLADLQSRVAEARDHCRRCEEQLNLWRERRQALLSENFEKANAIKQVAHARSHTMQEMHDAELRIARLEVKLAQTAQRLEEEYGITLDEALARPNPEELDRGTVNEIARLRREIRAMGQVNTGAVDEYSRLTERYDFLAEQRSDLDRARESLLATIREIDDSTREIFMTTFEAVSLEFSRLFQQLFGGGSTRLILTQPDDLLETGIDVLAQPPGKKPQHLSLLSGGERALTAVALLFSFLAVRPSPFCLLDEVDAPLDGANVEKFVTLVKQFAQDTQFLVITHNPTTMEAAPRWYGVTMQEPGVSRILSYHVPEESLESEPETAVA